MINTHTDPDEAANQPLVLINPKIIRNSKEMACGQEGCLSIPNVFLAVIRPAAIEVSFKDETGRPQKLKADDLLARVQGHIGDGLSEGDSSLEHVARRMAVSARTLRRRLSEAGTTHRELVDGVRRARASVYLQQQKLSIEDVAFLLGFGDTSAFHRAFKRWHGVTPAQFRRGD